MLSLPWREDQGISPPCPGLWGKRRAIRRRYRPQAGSFPKGEYPMPRRATNATPGPPIGLLLGPPDGQGGPNLAWSNMPTYRTPWPPSAPPVGVLASRSTLWVALLSFLRVYAFSGGDWGRLEGGEVTPFGPNGKPPGSCRPSRIRLTCRLPSPLFPSSLPPFASDSFSPTPSCTVPAKTGGAKARG